MPHGTRQQNKGEEHVSTTGIVETAEDADVKPGLYFSLSSHGLPICRLDRLRQVVPHAERANTAAFLEEVITFISTLKQRVVELEAGIPASERTVQPTVASAEPGSSLVVRGQSPQTNPADSDALLTASYASLPESNVAVTNAIKLQQPVSESALPASSDKESLEMAAKRQKLDNGGTMSALLS